MDFVYIGQTLLFWLLPIVIAITLHEAAHAWMADLCGDNTARMLGRVSFNPIRHVHPIGTLLLPGVLLILKAPILFGFAKPVPVYFNRLPRRRLGTILIAVAGPAANVVLVILSLLLIEAIRVLVESTDIFPAWLAFWATVILAKSMLINIVLAIFNMMPLLPLDGGRIVAALLPSPLDEKLQRFELIGLAVVLGLLIGLIVVIPWLAPLFGSDFNPALHYIEPALISVFLYIASFSSLDPSVLVELLFL